MCESRLANFVEHRSHNPGVDLRFRLVTTASVGAEGNKGTKFIDTWEAIRSGTVTGKGCLRTLGRIRAILRRGSKPKDLLQETWDLYRKHLDAARGPELLSIILAFEWSTGQANPEDLRAAIETTLRDRGWARSEAQAKKQYEALFAHVFHVLCIKGIKRLTAIDRDGVLAQPTLNDANRKVLETLDSVIARLAKLAARVDDHEEAIGQLQRDQNAMQRAVLESFALAQGIRAVITTTELPPDLGLPPGVTARTTRATTVASILETLKGLTWLGIYGTSGSGKTELALLVAQATGVSRHWLRLRDTSSPEALAQLDVALISLAGRPPGPDHVSWCDTLCAQLGRDHILVLDDLPQFEADSPFGTRLVQIASAFSRHGLKLITTASLPIPSRVCSWLGEVMVHSFAAPPFTHDEARELLQKHGAPPEWQDPGRVTIVNAVTHGHAELLVTAAFFLKQHDWRVSKEEFDGLLRGEYASGVERDTMRRLRTTVPEDETRQLVEFRRGVAHQTDGLI